MFRSRDHDHLHFQSQLQSLLAQGKQISESLTILASTFDGKLQPMIAAASKDAGGASLLALAERQPQLFDPDLTRLLRATEGADGGLGGFFSSYRRFRFESGSSLQAIRKRILGGLIYFSCVSLFSLFCLFVLSNFVLPKLREIAPAEEPGVGTLLLLVVMFAVLILVGLTWVSLLLFQPFASSATRLYIGGLRWVPGAGSFLRSWICSTSLGHLALLLEAGVPIEKAMKAAEPPASVPFSVMISRRIQISERAGTLPSQLREILLDQDFEVSKHADGMITGYLIVTYVIFGAWVAFLMIQTYMPIFKLGGSL